MSSRPKLGGKAVYMGAGVYPVRIVNSVPGDWVTWGTRDPWGTLIDSGGPVQLRVLGYNLGGVEFSALGMKYKWQKCMYGGDTVEA